MGVRNVDRLARKLRDDVRKLELPPDWGEVAEEFARGLERKLGEAQAEVYDDSSRFRVLIAGRRFGKTFLACTELLTRAVRKPGSLCWYVAPTHQMALEAAWPELKGLVPRELLAKPPNETYLNLELVNGSIVGLRTADRPDSLRGRGQDFLVMDEFALIDEEAWTVVLRPGLMDRGGSALFISTPKGFNWAYDAYLRGLEGGEWESWQFRTLDGCVVPESEARAARATMDARSYAQELEASFENLAGRVYSNFSTAEFPEGNIDPTVEDLGAELLVGMDFNVNPMSAVVAVRAGDECHVLEAIEILTSNTEEMASELRARYGPRKIVVYPDPSGRQRRTSAPVGQTDFTILRRAGFQVRASSAPPLVVDRVNNTQTMLLNAEGRRRLRIHSDEKPLIRALSGLTYKEGTSQPDKSSGLDHITDALGYLLWEEFNTMVSRRAQVGRFAI